MECNWNVGGVSLWFCRVLNIEMVLPPNLKNDEKVGKNLSNFFIVISKWSFFREEIVENGYSY